LDTSPTDESPVADSSDSLRPGAYRLGLRGMAVRVSSMMNVVEVEESTIPDSVHQQQSSTRPTEIQTSEVIMAEANLVVEPDLVEAKPVRRRPQLLISLAVVLVVAIVGAVIRVVVMGRVGG
jgi:hypothetical protein